MFSIHIFKFLIKINVQLIEFKKDETNWFDSIAALVLLPCFSCSPDRGFVFAYNLFKLPIITNMCL